MKQLLLIAILCTSCSVLSKKTTSDIQSPSLNQQFETIMSKYPEWQFQERNGYLVFQKENKTTSMHPEKILQVVVVDGETQKEIFNEKIFNGSFEWTDEFVFKVNYMPGNPEIGKKYFYYFNMKTQKKTTSISPDKI